MFSVRGSLTTSSSYDAPQANARFYDISLFNAVLTSSEVTAIYNSGNHNTGTMPSSLTHRWNPKAGEIDTTNRIITATTGGVNLTWPSGVTYTFGAVP